MLTTAVSQTVKTGPLGISPSKPQFRQIGSSNYQLQTIPNPTQATTQLQAIDAEAAKSSPVLKFIDDPAMFDLEALTCHSCNKSFKTPKAFSNHRDKHQVCYSYSSGIIFKHNQQPFYLFLG
jgi:hypothetical protein